MWSFRFWQIYTNKCINGLEPFDGGEIIVDGMNVGDLKSDLPKLRAKIGMVFQNFELFPHLNVLDNMNLAQNKVLKRSASHLKLKLKLSEYYYSDISLIYFIKIFVPPFSL